MPDDHVGELALVGPSSGALRLVLADLLGHEGTGWFMATDLGHVHDVEDRIDGAVSADIEPVTPGSAVAFAGRDRQWGGSAPSRELRLRSETARVSDLDEQFHGSDHADARNSSNRVSAAGKGPQQFVVVRFPLNSGMTVSRVSLSR
ncbi:hypothetical protein OHA59_46535 [Streptomyces sp. NBC_01589]